MLRLGDALVAAGSITRETLEQLAAKANAPLGRFLSAHDAAPQQHIQRALAQQLSLPFLDFQLAPPDPLLFTPRDLPHYHRLHVIPYRMDGGSLLLATTNPNAELSAWAKAHYGDEIQFAITSPRDLAGYFAERAALTSTRNATLGLRRRYPGLVADRVMQPHQLHGMGIIFAGILLACWGAPHIAWFTLLIACNLFYLATLVIKFQFYLAGGLAQRQLKRTEKKLIADAAETPDDVLPIYSVLVPLYRESSSVLMRLVMQLQALDYPRDKLDIKLIVEADDAGTIEALKAIRPPQCMEIIRVPPSHPRTKPKACNVALPQLRGEFVVIYDAEDAPAPDQLKRAVALFRRSPATVACLQASLNYYNRDECLLTQLFAIEYAALFGLLLPALERLRMPIPLGGTSNHLRLAALRDAGGWDAFNVTEDADLGVRLSYLGYETRILPSLTLEEAPIHARAWLVQRTRWIKGYIQTWLVFTRDVRELKRRLSRPAYYGFQFFVGAPALTFLLAPVFWAVFIVSIFGLFPVRLPALMQSICAFSLVSGIASNWLFARAVVQQQRWFHMRKAVLVYPVYWIMHSIAAGRALIQLARTPHRWEKTTHGVSQQFQMQ